ncbi:DUF1761 domain-containing protein [Candidatus Wolfebacteria bacterium]|nr:DUF1761 domain-containing protein [Candidatus Wolfebacteria bacterium]
MPVVPLNYLAVFTAAVSSMILGFLWHGPLFGKMWITLSGMTQSELDAAKARGMGKYYAIAFLGSLVMKLRLGARDCLCIGVFGRLRHLRRTYGGILELVRIYSASDSWRRPLGREVVAALVFDERLLSDLASRDGSDSCGVAVR